MMVREAYIRDVEVVRRHILEQLGALVTREMHTGEHRCGSEPIDTTRNDIERFESGLAEYDVILGHGLIRAHPNSD